MVSKAILDKIRQRLSKKDGSLKQLKKVPSWLFPHASDRRYRRSLYEYTFQIRKITNEILVPLIPQLLLEATIMNPDPVISQDSLSECRGDDFIDTLNAAMRRIRILLAPHEQEAVEASRRAGVEIALFNESQFNKTVDTVLGVDVFLEEPWLKNQLELFANQNAELIDGLTDEEIKRVSGIVQRGLQEGSSNRSIEKEINNSFGITRRHAKLIARDQTSKLNGSLTKLRQQELGVTQYIWQTSLDERVRKTHKALEGKTCRWDDPTVFLDRESGKWKKRSSIGGSETHPSVDVNCRCVPLAVLEGIFE